MAAKVAKPVKLKPAAKKLAAGKGSGRLAGKKASMPDHKTVTCKKLVLTANRSASSSASSRSSRSSSASESGNDSVPSVEISSGGSE